MEVFYFGYFDTPLSKERRYYAPAATNKMNYIADSLVQLGFIVNIVSFSLSIKKDFIYGSKSHLRSKVYLYKFFSLPYSKILFFKLFRFIFFNIHLFFFLITKLKKNSIVLIYHSLGNYKLIKFFKKILKFKSILELEEIYSDTLAFEKFKKAKELQYIQLHEKYLISNISLKDLILDRFKPFLLSNGVYKVEPILSNKINDGRLHVVYAGNLNPERGVNEFIESAKFLNENFQFHIIGFGNKHEIEKLETNIETNNKIYPCKIKYDGILEGLDYIKYIQQYHLGVCPQWNNNNFNDSSFPSKVLSYLANRLQVLTIEINAIKNSPIGDIVFYFSNHNPKSIADSLINIKIKDFFETEDRMNLLQHQFISGLKELLNV